MAIQLRRDGYGPLASLDDFDVIPKLVRVSERAWELFFHSFTSGKEVRDRDAADTLSKLVYHAQNCSYSIGLLTTWAQPLEALVLLRTRFEQLTTSSYLVHASIEEGLALFQQHTHRMDLNVLRKMRNDGAPLMDFLDQLLGARIQETESEALKKEREFNPDYELGQRLGDSWTSKNKLVLARDRDKLAQGKHPISDFRLEDYYHGLYRLGSGMVHVDPNTLTQNYVTTAPDGITITPHIFQVFLNLIQCAHFDLVQSFEVTHHLGVALTDEYEALDQEYKAVASEIIGPEVLLEMISGS